MTDNNKLYYGIGIGISIVVLIALIPFTAKSDDIYFVNSGGGVNGNLTDLGDVVITSPANTQVLKYNGTYWVNDTDNIGTMAGFVHKEEIKNAIGTTYTDISTTCGSITVDAWNCLTVIDCSTTNQILITFIWDYVGTGSQSVRWVDFNNQNNVLIEITGIIADQNIGSSNWFAKPSWCVSEGQQIKMQGKSTVATDSPISLGYEVRVR